MAIITDPDLLNQGVEVTLDTALRTIALNAVGNLSADGVTLQALYSFLKEEWRADAALPAFPFPFTPITDESYELVEGWDFANNVSRELVRAGGWAVRNAAGAITAIYAGVIGLGTIEADDQLYFDNGAGATNFARPGQVNQAIQVLSDPNGDGNFVDGFDRRASLTLFAREQGQIFDSANLSDIGVAQMEPIAYRFPLSTAPDLKIATADIGIDATADGIADILPYSGMSITYLPHQNRGAWAAATVYAANDVVQDSAGRWFLTAAGGTSAGTDANLAGGSDTGVAWTAFAGERQIGASWFAFGVIIDGNNASAEQIYEFAQFQLRQALDIDAGAGTVIGRTADALLEFVGDTLKTVRQSDGAGVAIDNFDAADINRLVMIDDGGVERSFPFTASLTLQFNANLQNDPNAKYFVYFTTLPGVGDDFGEAGAVLVDDNAGLDMTGLVGGAASVALSFDYDGNAQAGRTPATDAAITVVAIGLDTAQYVRATGVIGRSTANQVSLVAPLERNFENPV